MIMILKIMKTINSLSNQTIKEAVRLKKTGERKTRGLIIIDGAREIELAIELKDVTKEKNLKENYGWLKKHYEEAQ